MSERLRRRGGLNYSVYRRRKERKLRLLRKREREKNRKNFRGSKIIGNTVAYQNRLRHLYKIAKLIFINKWRTLMPASKRCSLKIIQISESKLQLLVVFYLSYFYHLIPVEQRKQPYHSSLVWRQ